MNADLVCSIDIGTSAIRAAVTTADGTRVQQASHPRAMANDATTFKAEGLWTDVVRVIRRVLEGTPNVRLAAFGVTGHVGTVFTDARGDPIGEGLTWADARGVDLLASRYASIPDHVKATGRSHVNGCSTAALAWLGKHRPNDAARVRWVLTPKDFVLYRLTARAVTDPTSAAYTLAFDVGRLAWDGHLLEAAHVDAGTFPDIVPAWEVVAGVSAAAAETTGLRPGLSVIAGGPDGTVGIIGACAARRDVIADIAGTTDVLARLLDVLPDAATPAVILNPYPVSGTWTIGGPTGMTGGAVSRFSTLLGYSSLAAAYEDLGGALRAVPPGSDGLFVSPHLTGARFPFWRADERAAVWGLDLRHSAAHLLHACEEGAAFVVRRGVERLRASRDEPVGVVVAGGTVRSERQAQLRADVLGRAIEVPDDPDVTLLGAAILASLGGGIHRSVEAAWSAMASATRVYEPDPERAASYDRVFDRWLAVRERYVDFNSPAEAEVNLA